MLSSGEERPVHWSLLGAGVEGCYRESPPNFDYQPPRQLPPETDLWHRKKVQLLFHCASRFRWGTVVHGGGVEEQKKPNKQTNKTQAASYNSSHTTTPEKVNRRYFSLFWKQEPNPKKEKRPSPLLNKTTLFYKRSPREALIRESRCATFISSILNNQSVHFDHQRHIFTHAEQHS